ncbi:alpha-L-fucosidase-like [Nematostella vectensis]|uniref:alpha-L-fucosidase-like n=1 Tax=Nematostella vectensis TaxID=45351 RepID=UPI002076F65F|nr:alpha-L-fucosidase-like [Nematostella vectensis]
MLLQFTTVLLALNACFHFSHCKYLPSWDSLDSRPDPPWYDKAKFGVFMHWGVYSVPSFGSEWFWNHWKQQHYPSCIEFMKKNYPSGFSYADFGPMFKAEFFDPNYFAKLVAKSGARYFVLTSKHHEGWTNWKSNTSWNWNSVDNGPHRDLTDDMATAIRQYKNITFGLYYSLYEWFHPLYLEDQHNKYKTQGFVKGKVIPELHDLVTKFKPEYIWSDGDWDASPDYWTSKKFLAWLYNDSPVKETVLVNDRWGAGCMCHHGSVYTCADHYNPGVLQKHKWENAMSIDKRSWGYRRNATIDEYYTTKELVSQLVTTVSCGGNLLLNVGPTADGRVIPVFEERLLQMEEWLDVNGQAIYDTKPWRAQNDTGNVWYTSTKEAVYAIALDWPSSGHLILNEPITSSSTVVTLLGSAEQLKWVAGPRHGLVITAPTIPLPKMPCKWAWTFKLENIR